MNKLKKIQRQYKNEKEIKKKRYIFIFIRVYIIYKINK